MKLFEELGTWYFLENVGVHGGMVVSMVADFSLVLLSRVQGFSYSFFLFLFFVLIVEFFVLLSVLELSAITCSRKQPPAALEFYEWSADSVW
jgi:hypothetical protein